MPKRREMLPVGTRIIVRRNRGDTEGTIIEHILIEEKKPKYLVKFNDGLRCEYKLPCDIVTKNSGCKR